MFFTVQISTVLGGWVGMVEGGALQRRQELEKMPPMKLKATAKRVGVVPVPVGATPRTLVSSPQSSAALYRSVCLSVGWSG